MENVRLHRHENTRKPNLSYDLKACALATERITMKFKIKKKEKENGELFARIVAKIAMQMTHSVAKCIYEFHMIFKF